MDGRQALMLVVITIGAVLMPLLSERLGWFTAPLEMLYGAAAAAVIPDLRHPGEFISTLAQFGFLLVMFLVGLDIDFTQLQRRGVAMLGRAALAALGMQVAAMALVVLLHWPAINVLLISALSVSLLLTVLHEADLSQREFGQTLLVVGAIGEFLSIFELTGYDLFSSYGLNWMLAVAALKMLALLLVGYLALRALTHLAQWQPHPIRRIFAVFDGPELGVRAALAFMLCFAAVAVLLHVEEILATFIAGTVCSYAFRGQHVVTRKVTTIGQGFFLPIFFISVGMNVQLSALLHPQALLFMGALLLALLAVRLAAVPLLVLTGLSWQQGVPAALLLASPLTLLVAISQVGVSLHQLDPQNQGAVLGAAIASAVIFPVLARAVLKRAGGFEQSPAIPAIEAPFPLAAPSSGPIAEGSLALADYPDYDEYPEF